MSTESAAPVIPITLPGKAPLILYLSVNLHELSRVGKAFCWQRPLLCPQCNGVRLWSHGYVERYFDEVLGPIWMKRWRCTECRAVHTARPREYWRGFLAASATIIAGLQSRIEKNRWLWSATRQRQEYWWRGLEICRMIHGMTWSLDSLVEAGQIVATHSLLYREIRPTGEPLHRIFACTPSVRAP